MSTEIKEIKRTTGLLIIEAVNSNPNGDPDRDSDPRQRPNNHGEISPVSFKRKLRDLLEDTESPFIKELFKKLPKDCSKNPENYRILESRGIKINAKKEMGKNTKKFDEREFLKSKFVEKYWDARIFGNTVLEEGGDKGYIKTGVAQFGVGISISPIDIVRHTNTGKAEMKEGKSGNMAPLAFRVVEHGVYAMPFFVNPNYAGKSGCTLNDIELLKLLIPHAYDLNRSAIRPDIRLRHAWYMEHKSILGSCPDYLLLEALTPKRKENISEPSTSWADYEDITDLPEELSNRLYSCVDLVEL